MSLGNAWETPGNVSGGKAGLGVPPLGGPQAGRTTQECSAHLATDLPSHTGLAHLAGKPVEIVERQVMGGRTYSYEVLLPGRKWSVKVKAAWVEEEPVQVELPKTTPAPSIKPATCPTCGQALPEGTT